ncbi:MULTISPECIES: hypothetical protein, partial [unclassified Ruminococcus]|uniref:hypothetical protein n=1 Tax=unclassified Ruminococcus TaxID=2608920 RepID=UPI00189DB02B
MSAKQLALPDFTLKKKLILIIMFLVLLQNIVLLIFANYQFSQKELKSSIEHIQNECHLLHNDMKTQYHNVILCSNELISTINQTQNEQNRCAMACQGYGAVFLYTLIKSSGNQVLQVVLLSHH